MRYIVCLFENLLYLFMRRITLLLFVSYCLLAVACDRVKNNPEPDPLQGLELKSLQFDLVGKGPWEVNFQDSFPSTSSLTYTIFQQPANGSVSLDPSGNFLFTPDSGFYGTDYAIYQVCNGNVCRDGIISVSISDTTTPCIPSVGSYNYEILSGISVLVPLPEQFGCGAGITGLISPESPFLKLVNGKVYASFPANQLDSVTFSIVSCNQGKCDTGDVQIVVGTISCVQKFKAYDDLIVKSRNEREFSIWITNRVGTSHLIYNDSACLNDLNLASFQIIEGFSKGTFTLKEPNSQGRAIRYKANANFLQGIDSLTYKISGYSGATSTAKVFIKIN